MNGIFVKLKNLTHRADGKLRLSRLLITGFILLASLQIIIAVVFLAYATYDEISREPQSKQNQLEIEREFRQIQHPSKAAPTSTDLRFSRKTHSGIVGLLFQTDLSYPEIRSYYDNELSKHGWNFRYEEKLLFKGQDIRTMQAIYCKGMYQTSIHYQGTERYNSEWRYAVNVSWGLSGCDR